MSCLFVIVCKRCVKVIFFLVNSAIDPTVLVLHTFSMEQVQSCEIANVTILEALSVHIYVKSFTTSYTLVCNGEL